jgi:hypothetical protein
MPTKKRIIGPLALVVGALATSFVVAYALKSQSMSRAVSLPSVKPFVAYGTVRNFPAPGSNVLSMVHLIIDARRSDGSWMDSTTSELPSGGPGYMRTFWDIASKKKVIVESATKSTMTYPLTVSEIRGVIQQTEFCPPSVDSPAASHKQILGYDTVKVVEEEPSPHHGKRVTTSWVAPKLGCYALQSSGVRSDGPHTETEVTRVVEGPPPAWMFEAPDGYVERAPSQLSAEWQAKFGRPFLSDAILANMDKVYFARRGN